MTLKLEDMRINYNRTINPTSCQLIYHIFVTFDIIIYFNENDNKNERNSHLIKKFEEIKKLSKYIKIYIYDLPNCSVNDRSRTSEGLGHKKYIFDEKVYDDLLKDYKTLIFNNKINIKLNYDKDHSDIQKIPDMKFINIPINLNIIKLNLGYNTIIDNNPTTLIYCLLYELNENKILINIDDGIIYINVDENVQIINNQIDYNKKLKETIKEIEDELNEKNYILEKRIDQQNELINKLQHQMIENSRIKINDDNKLCIKNVALNKKSYTFKYNANESSDVYITGTFNNWEKIKMTNENNIWKYYIDLDEGTYEYKFIINDEWKHDEKQPIITNNGIINNIIIL